MQCSNCGRKAAEDWRVCPYCGTEFRRSFFEEMDREFEEVARTLMRSFDVFQRPGRGVALRIHQEGGRPPEVSVAPIKRPRKAKVGRPRPEKTVEPEAKTTSVGGKIVAELAVPEVRKPQDVEIHVLENSVEIRAYGKNVLYFKILKIPEGATVTNRRLEGGKLLLEIAKE